MPILNSSSKSAMEVLDRVFEPSKTPGMHFTVGGIAHICLTVVSNHCGYTPRGVRGVKRPEILWEIQKYSLPGRPSSQNWVKSKTIKKFIKIP